MTKRKEEAMTETKVTRPISEVSENGKIRRLSIYIGVEGEKVDFKFTGHWTGKDVELIQRTIRRAYVSYGHSIRRAAKPTLQESLL